MTTAATQRLEEQVREASDAFYSALNAMFTGDMGPMGDVWSRSEDVTLMTPFGGRHEGYDAVMRQLSREAGIGIKGEIVPKERLLRGQGELGYDVCREVGRGTTIKGQSAPIDHRATTIFRQENGRWKVVHHHTDAVPALQEMAPWK